MRKAALPGIAAVVLFVLLALSGCGTDAPAASNLPAPPTSAPPSSAPGAPAAPTGATPASTPAAPAGRAVQVTYAGGKATGDTGRIKVKPGEQVSLTVTSDVKEEVHIHGVDLHVDLEPGVPVTTTFAEPAPGIYEVELHDAGTVLTRLQVS